MHATLCDLMTDLVQNSVEAEATEIRLTLRETETWLEFEIKDNGKGMSREIQKKAVDPFYSNGRKHAHRRVGLGLPFLFQTAETAGGSAAIESIEGDGTVIRFRAQTRHVDLPPLGDFAGTAAMALTMLSSGELIITHTRNEKGYTVTRNEMNDALGGLHDAGSLTLLKTYIASQEEDLRKAG